MTIRIEDFLVEKPFCLIYWKLSNSLEPVETYFKKEHEVKHISSPEEIIYWLKVGEVKTVILGASSFEELKDFKEVIEKKIPIEDRRKFFLIYILPSVTTLSSKDAFVLGANLVINPCDLNHFDKLYEKASLYWKSLYKPFYTALEKFLEEI